MSTYLKPHTKYCLVKNKPEFPNVWQHYPTVVVTDEYGMFQGLTGANYYGSLAIWKEDSICKDEIIWEE